MIDFPHFQPPRACRNYILDDNRVPVPCYGLLRHTDFMADHTNVVVQATPLRGPHGVVTVSTVFLGFDYNFIFGGTPAFFETKIFGAYLDDDPWHYATWPEAEAGHQRVVEELRPQLANAVKRHEDLLALARTVLFESIEPLDPEPPTAPQSTPSPHKEPRP